MSGINTNRTNISLPTAISQQIIQKTQEDSAVMRLATQIALPGNGLTIPVITSDPTAAWVDETDEKPVSNPGLGTKVMRGYKLAVIEPFSNQFRRDYGALFDALVARLPRILAEKFDNTVFGGTAAPGDDFDTFASCTAQSIQSNVYGGLVAADTDVATHGGILNGFAVSPQMKGILLAAVDKNDRPLFVNSVAEGAVDRILGQPTYLTKGAYVSGSPSTVGVAGDWTKAMYGIVEGVDISFSSDATLTLANSSTINLFQRNMFAVRAEIEIGFRADKDCFNRLTATPGGQTGQTGA